MNVRLIILSFICLLTSSLSFSQSGWFQLNSGTIDNLYSITFVNSQTGFACGENNTLLKTTNGGNSWQAKLPSSNVWLLTLCFVDQNTGWTAGTNGVILKTTNYGENWISQTDSSTIIVYSLFFVNPLTGWLVNPVCKTTNGGNNWIYQGTLNENRTIFFINSSTGFVTGHNGDIYQTTNGGTTWFFNSGFWFPHMYLYSLFFANSYTGWAAGGLSLIKTTNGGVNWFGSSTSIQVALNSLFFISPDTGWGVGWGQGNYRIAKTKNAGTNWAYVSIGDSGWFNSVYFINSSTGWIAGDYGQIYKTTNGGELIGIRKISSEVPSGFILYQNYPNPFNPVTTIKFDIPFSPLSERGVGGFVTMKVFDFLGREVTTLISEHLKPAGYQASWDASNYPSGVYFYKLTSGNYTETKKMVLIK